MSDRPSPRASAIVLTGLMHLLPHHLLGRLAHWVTRCEWPPVKDWLIRKAVARFHVDLSQAAESDPTAYASFNAFFTRTLRPGARPIADAPQAICCPSDGEISQIGSLSEGMLVQAKAWDYSLRDLLGGDSALADELAEGSYATIYLSPRDYHRVHMPLAGTLRRMVHVPGRLFSVNQTTTETLPRLFARNERVISVFDTDRGPMAVILVGAFFVGSMDTVWAGTVAPAHRRATVWDYAGREPIRLERGAEMGRFNMGSTVILLIGSDRVQWAESATPGATVRMGEILGTLAD